MEFSFLREINHEISLTILAGSMTGLMCLIQFQKNDPLRDAFWLLLPFFGKFM